MSHTATALLFLIANLLDALSTYLGLERGLHEANPLASRLLASDGWSGLTAFKGFGLLGALLLVLLFGRRYPRLWWVLTVLSCALLVAATANLVQAVIE